MRTIFSRKISYLLVFIIIIISSWHAYSITIINSPLNNALLKIFPELKQGYIDLNNNGKLDQSDELSETIPETELKDNHLQGKEILDFIIDHYMFLSLDKVRKVKDILDNPRGVISEIVALQYRLKIYEIEKRREEMQKSGKRAATTSEVQKTKKKLNDLINTMINSYKKEGQKSELELIAARKEFLKIINDGFRVPNDINDENKNILTSIMINRILSSKKGEKENQEIITAIEVVGQLKQDFAVSYLMDFLSDKKYKKYVIRSLGNIGNSVATKRLLKELQKDQPLDIKIEIIRALGNIGNKDVIDALKNMLKSKEEMQNIEVKKEVFLALSNASEKYQDPTLVPIFSKYLKSEEPYFKMVSIRGLANLNAFNAVNELTKLLKDESDPLIQLELIRALHKLKATNYITTFGLLLNKHDLDPSVRKAILEIYGDENRTELVIGKIINYIGYPDSEIQKIAKNAILKQSRRNPKVVATNLSNILIRSKNKSVLVNGSEILSKIKDPISIPTFLNLTKSDYKKVRENATWGIYKIGKIDNINVISTLLSIATNESQPISVRTNAIRALGVIGYSDNRLNTVESLINIVKLQDDKYTMMRYFAIKSIGEIGQNNQKAIHLLTKMLLTENNLEIKKAIIDTLDKLGNDDKIVIKSLKKAYFIPENSNIQIDIITTMGDLGTEEVIPIASEFISDDNKQNYQKITAIYTLSRIGTKDCIAPILSATTNINLKNYAISALQDFDPDIILPYLKNRMKSETNKKILDMINSLIFRLEEE